MQLLFDPRSEAHHELFTEHSATLRHTAMLRSEQECRDVCRPPLRGEGTGRWHQTDPQLLRPQEKGVGGRIPAPALANQRHQPSIYPQGSCVEKTASLKIVSE